MAATLFDFASGERRELPAYGIRDFSRYVCDRYGRDWYISDRKLKRLGDRQNISRRRYAELEAEFNRTFGIPTLSEADLTNLRTACFTSTMHKDPKWSAELDRLADMLMRMRDGLDG